MFFLDSLAPQAGNKNDEFYMVVEVKPTPELTGTSGFN